MIKNLLFISLLLFSISLFAQAPQKMSYQSVVRTPEGKLVKKSQVKVRISLLKGSEDGTRVYGEIHHKSTNDNGLVSLKIGEGTQQMGQFSAIDWSAGPYFIKAETDPAGGNDYPIEVITELMSVPYALYAANSPAGPQGEMGPQGPAGPKGQTGVNGPVGPPGSTGATGPAGPHGIQGIPGIAGSQGIQGIQGVPGIQGTAGVSGTNGISAYQVWLANGGSGTETDFINFLKGAQGIQGFQGVAGPIGPQGMVGVTGATGPEGQQGTPGISGPQGVAGAVGATGAAGIDGTNGISAYQVWLANGGSGTETDFINFLKGVQGIQGIAGPIGPQGMIGATGTIGLTGATGLTGPQGIQGIQGVAGPIGPQGMIGATGAIGLTGATGLTGPQGIQGIQGIAGPIGPQGMIGATGAIGLTGATGLMGPQGIQGIQGVAGPIGPQGMIGATGAIGLTGATGLTGPQGIQGIQGIAGPIGPQGMIGATGAIGLTGATGMQGLLPNSTQTGATAYWDGTAWVINNGNIYNNGGSVGVGTLTPATSAKLEVASTVQGFLPPRMTYAQRNAIVSPVAGLVIWCNNCGTKGELQVHNDTEWTNMTGGTAAVVILAIGDSYQGGKIGYLLKPGDVGYDPAVQHGIIITENDYGPFGWGCDTTLIGTSAAIGSGQTNTTAIVNANCAAASTCARVCNDLILDGYSDWYLPSLDELLRLSENKVAIGSASFNGYYYCSTELANNAAKIVNANSPLGNMAALKNLLYKFRPVRSF
ncbi:hypothetical protein [Flavobacterium cerinum]|uniref:DUF1566 domain-containing protein n=1 Tax=Flavobacterium cerinum TaxID=2502784 RepID=A0A444H9K1_9FLAO|nr:hypothetical protein [Flavobacterium cerinum]RWW99938.1 hypothetical protein EPI11_10350 [Flavobacterium cerinum]